MMPPVFHFEMVTPDGSVFAGDVSSLVVPGAEGYLGVLAHHAPLLSALAVGEARATTAQGDVYFAVAGGFFEVAHNRAVLLADAAERAEEIDVVRAQAARERAERARAEYGRGESAYAAAEAALHRALNRLRVARERSARE